MSKTQMLMGMMAAAAAKDPYASMVKLQVQPLSGASSYPADDTGRPLTYVGNAALGGALVAGTRSIYGDGTGDYLTTPMTSDLQLGSQDWTIEGVLYRADGPTMGILGSLNSGMPDGYRLALNASGDGQLSIFWYDVGGGKTYTSVGAIPLGTATQYALCRHGNDLRIYIGTSLDVAHASVFSGAVTNATNPDFILGKDANAGTSGYSFHGYFIHRITIGVARYTGSTMPAQTAPWVL